MRKIHNVDWIAGGSPIKFLTDRLPASRNQIIQIGRWLKVPVAKGRLVEWADHDVAKRWGVIRASRLVHIIRTGNDCSVGRPRKDQRASEIEVVTGTPVPGTKAPVTNAYHAYQALLWIANVEQSIDRQEELLGEVMGLMRESASPIPV